ncbi:MAG: hypothetical protein BMS9Abin12_0189 [Acidimicrobiia bacterium]|nr:MAG: hypothetical protein BMS9Abin12_0189 [Acidimicrobiia bacterium]
MVVVNGLLAGLVRLCRRRCRGTIGRRWIAELERLEHVIELIAAVITLHFGSSSPLFVERCLLAVSGVLCHE